MMSFEVQTTAVATQEHSVHLVCISSALVRPVIMYLKWDCISITIIQGYTEQYHHFIAVGCLVTSAQYEWQWQRQQTSDTVYGTTLYYGDNNFSIQFIVWSDVHVAHMTRETKHKFLSTAHTYKTSPLTPVHSWRMIKLALYVFLVRKSLGIRLW